MSLYRGRVFGFEIQHLFPNEIISGDTVPAENARNLLSSIGFDVEWRGNKMSANNNGIFCHIAA